MQELGDAILRESRQRLRKLLVGQARCYVALDSSPVCITDPVCASARIELQRLDTARQDGTFTKIADLARQLQLTQGARTLGVDPDGAEPRPRDGQPRDASLRGSDEARQPAGPPGHAAARAPTPWPTRAARSPTAYSCWSTRPSRWAAGSGEASQFLLAMKQDASTPVDGRVLHPARSS